MTGFSAAVKLACRTRAGGGDPFEAACEGCGIWLGRYGGQIQHRRARGKGGSRNPVTSSIVNALLLCGTNETGDHGLAESRDDDAHEAGWWLRQDEDPRLVPVMIHGLQGGATQWLTPEGGYSTAPPQEAVA